MYLGLPCLGTESGLAECSQTAFLVVAVGFVYSTFIESVTTG